MSFEKVALLLGGNLSSSFKLFHLGKVRDNNVRPLKIIFWSKKDTANLLTLYSNVKKSGAIFPPNFHIVENKTPLQFNVNCCGFVILK